MPVVAQVVAIHLLLVAEERLQAVAVLVLQAVTATLVRLTQAAAQVAQQVAQLITALRVDREL